MERSNYLWQHAQATHQKLVAALSNTKLTLRGWEGTFSGSATVACQCGNTEVRRVSDILRGAQKGNLYGCRACSRRRVMQAKAQTDAWKQHQARMVKAAAAAVSVGQEWSRLRRVCQCAKDRCENPRSAGYRNYGGRGIRFEFESASAMALWVQLNLGPRPEGGTLDRRDNDLGYAPGNLRWASPAEQNRNKRRYVGSVYGDRLRNLEQLRPDVTYETLRQWVKKGLTDAEILARRKHASGRPRRRV